MTDIIIQAYQVLDEIKKDPIFQEIKRLDTLIVQTFSKEIVAFQQAKNAYDIMMTEGGSYHPDYKRIVKDYAEKKATLYQQSLVQAYFERQKSLENMLNQFLKELSLAISDHIKTPNKLGIIEKGGSCHVR